ncbi:hypothetical protein Tco_0613582 [Tanacetum coccineum]
MSIDAYFRKIESIATILTSLGSTMDNDDVVTFALEGLPARYDKIATIIAHREPFPDLKTVRSMLTTEEMCLKSRVQDAFVDTTSSSRMVLLANSGSNARNSSSFIEKLGCHGNISLKQPIGQNNATNTTANPPLALHTSHNPGYALTHSPLGFHGPSMFYSPTPAPAFVLQTTGPSVTTSNLVAQPTQLTGQNPTKVQQGVAGPTSQLTGQETLLPHAFTVGTL